MKRELRITGDGSHTFFVGDMEEPYHSAHGAIQESEHVFMLHGFRQVGKSFIRVLEIGFGTGLNMLLTFRESVDKGVSVFYHAVEKYPLAPEEYSQLNYEKLLGNVPPGTLQKIHEASWGEDVALSDSFRFHKEHTDIR
ncbi:MAG TPA: SAM-dependent methyltransferase, partial [Bacteroides sp.]|nr:SAM-dependent methyltransferase [Bacteroides sp.]